jgi:tetratricopeptide (TPR) repeat protein
VENLAAEWNNIDVAADWLIERGDDASLVRMTHGIWVYLWVDNHLRDGARYLAAVSAPESLDDLLAGRYWFLRGGIAYEMGDYEMSKESIDRALTLVEANGDIDCHNWSDFVSALLLPVAGADPAEIEERLEVALARFRGFGDRWGEGYALIALGILAGSRGDTRAAENHQLATRDIGRELGNGAMIGLAEAQLGFTYISSGQMAPARDALRRSFDLFREMNYREGLCYALEAAASLSFAEGKAELGMIALGAAEEVRERIGLHPWPLIMWLFDALSSMADSLEDRPLQAARHNGRQMNPFAAAEVVLEASPLPV